MFSFSSSSEYFSLTSISCNSTSSRCSSDEHVIHGLDEISSNESFNTRSSSNISQFFTDEENSDDEYTTDPLMVSEYVVEIFEYLKEKEPETQPNPDYIHHQENLLWSHRSRCVHDLFRLNDVNLIPEILFLAVNILDRFLSVESIKLNNLQTISIAAMVIAMKYENKYSYNVLENFQWLTKEKLFSTERLILHSLDFNLSYSNPMDFVRRISKADNDDRTTFIFAKYFMKITLLEYPFLKYFPSKIAAAAMYLALRVSEKSCWIRLFLFCYFLFFSFFFFLSCYEL